MIVRSPKHPILLLIAGLAFAGAVRAQGASVTIFGTPCTTPEGTPKLSHTGLPKLGQSFDIDYDGPNRMGGTFDYHPHLVIGAFRLAPPITIPRGMFPGQPSGCAIHATHDVVIPMPYSRLVRPAYEAKYTLRIPNDPALQGVSFFVQWFTTYVQCGIVPPCWLSWVATSEAGFATIGR